MAKPKMVFAYEPDPNNGTLPPLVPARTPNPTPQPPDHGAAGFCTDHAQVVTFDTWATSPERSWNTDAPDERVETVARVLRKADPEVVVLCGSTRFYDEFQQANYDLTMAGKIVLSVGFYPHAKARHGHGEGVGHDSAEKAALDELHKRKIDLADRVLVLNVGGYIGSSTFGEIEYAWDHRKPIDYLVPLGQCSCDDGDRHPRGLPCGPSAVLGLIVTEHTPPGDAFPDGFALDDETARLRASADAWWTEYDRELKAHEATKAEAERLTRIVNGYDRTPAVQRAADAEVEWDEARAALDRVRVETLDALPVALNPHIVTMWHTGVNYPVTAVALTDVLSVLAMLKHRAALDGEEPR